MSNKTLIKKYTTLEELEKSSIGPVYVLNSTSENMDGNVIISIPKRNGNGSDLARVPKTFIPIDLTLQVNRDQLLGASEFRKTVGRGLIKLVSPEYAKLLLATPEAKEEQLRLVNEQNKARNILKASGVSEAAPEEEEDEYVEVNNVQAEVDKVKSKKKAAKPSLKVEAAIAELKADNAAVSVVLAKLRNIKKMTSNDLAYISKEYKDKPRVINYLKERLAEMREAANAD